MESRAIFGHREISAATVAMTVVALYFALVLLNTNVSTAAFFELFGIYASGAFALWFVVGMGFMFAMLWRNRPKQGEAPSPFVVIRTWVAGQWRDNRLIKALWPPMLFAMLITPFNVFKQTILSTRAFTDDPWLIDADRWLFFGQDGWRFFHDLFGSPAATQVIDTLYHSWFAPMSIGVVVCAFLGDSSYRLRTQYLLTYIFVWIGLGSVMAFIFPSAGPCFYNLFVGPQQSYADLMALLHQHDAVLAQSGGHVLALSNMDTLAEVHVERDTLVIGGGISAMPSVHNGLSILFALAAFKVNRWAGYAMGAYAVLIWVASVYLGWHYGLDGIVSAIAILGFWPVAGLVADALDRGPQTSVAGGPVPLRT